METIFLYFGKMILVSTVMSAYYLLFLRDKTFHHYNRFYLLGTMVLSLLLPLLKVEYFTIETDSRILLLLNQFNQNSSQEVENTFNFWNFGALILGIVSFYLLAKLTLGLVKIHQLKKEFPKESIEGITFYNTNLHDAPFSFFRNLFWKKSILINSDLGKQILKHEMVHIEQKHSFDKLFVQIIQSLFWFNPIFYFIKKEITLIHEYLADKKAVKNADTRAFAQMLLASNFSGNVLPATSPFLSSNLKKRLKMLTQKNTKYSYARRILALPILFGVSFALLVNAKNKEIRDFNISLSKMIKDTAKINSAKAIISSENIGAEAKNASEKAMFLIDAKEVSKKEFLEYLDKNKENKNLILTTMHEKDQPDHQTVMGEKGKYGVFQVTTKEGLENNIDEYHALIKKYNPKHYNNVIVKNKLNEERKSIAEVGKSLQQKTKELKSLKPESKEFQSKLDEIDKLSNKLSEKEFQDDFMFLMKLKDTLSTNNNYKLNWVQIEKKLDNGISYKIKIDSINKKNNLTKEEIKKLEKLSKERGDLAQKQAELARKQAEIAKQQAEISRKYAQNNPWVITVDANVPKDGGVSISADKIKYNLATRNSEVEGLKSMKVFSDKSIKYYINGKLSTKEEMDKLKPENIAAININKNVNNGKEEGEIRIQTK